MMGEQPTCRACNEPRSCVAPYCIDCQTPRYPKWDRR